MKKGPVFLTHSVVFQHQTAWQYSDGNGGVECRWGRQKSRFRAHLASLRAVNVVTCQVLSTRAA